jgi:NADPH-dependent glutamate synthase beta subunit-like oxidoreductase
MMPVANPVRRVAVIGAGPSGLAALKYVEFGILSTQLDTQP